MTTLKFSGAAGVTELNGGFASAVVPGVGDTFLVADATGYPSLGAGEGFVITISRDEPDEEKVLVTARSGNTLTVGQRGYDGTTAAAHGNGSSVRHTIDGVTMQLLYDHLADTSAAHAASAVANTPAGNIAATTVQAAVNELDTEKSATGHSHSIPTTATFYTTHTWVIANPTASTEAGKHFIKKAANQVIKLIEVRDFVIGGTSVTYDLERNGSAISGGSGLSATTTDNESDFADVTLSDADVIEPDPTTVTGSVTLWMVTIVLEHTITLA